MADSPSEQYRIAELAQRTGVTPRTIRYYVAEGLLPPPTGAGPQRFYDPSHLLRLEAIQRLKQQYLPLAEIRRRLTGATRKDLEVIVNDSTLEPNDSRPEHPATPAVILPPVGGSSAIPGRFIASLSNRGASLGGTPTDLSDLLRAASRSPRSGRPEDAPPLAEEDVGEQVWNRVLLAPGVELNYQLTGDRARDAAVLRLIRNARQILGNVS